MDQREARSSESWSTATFKTAYGMQGPWPGEGIRDKERGFIKIVARACQEGWSGPLIFGSRAVDI